MSVVFSQLLDLFFQPLHFFQQCHLVMSFLIYVDVPVQSRQFFLQLTVLFFKLRNLFPQSLVDIYEKGVLFALFQLVSVKVFILKLCLAFQVLSKNR